MTQRGEQVYRLKLDMLLTVLGAARQTCQVRAEVSFGTITAVMGSGKLGRVGKERDNSMAQVELSLQDGQVISAVIFTQNGQTLAQGAKALTVGTQCGELSWVVRLMPSEPQDAPFAQPSATERLVRLVGEREAPRRWSGRSPPRWARHLTQEEVNALPRKHRQVLLLIDGNRGIGQLCQMLNATPDQVAVILDELISKQLILFPRDEEE